ncbi:MAG: rhodanese-like domain-containing protein [Flavobacteriales bacterium]|nr:rhodanese-like domain-containing protein [Flavobacteriales bacterium]
MDLATLLEQPEMTIVDVRTPGEFHAGHVPGSVNIPMQEVVQRLDELKAMGRPLVLCCLSGNRSGQVQAFLQGQGMEGTYNGGPWTEVANALADRA